MAGLAALEAEAGAARQQVGLLVGEQEHVGFHELAAVEAEAEDPQRHPGGIGRDREHDRRAVAGGLAELGGAGGVEAGGHEDLAAVAVEVEHLGGIRREEEAVVAGPAADLVAAALEHRDVEGVDLLLEDHLGAIGVERRSGGLERALGGGRGDLLGQALERPVAAAHHVGGDVGERDDRADRLAVARELERRDVALHPVVVGGEGRGLGRAGSSRSRRPGRRRRRRERRWR